MGTLRRNLIGQRFGRLVVLSRAESNQFRVTYYNCVCDCGKHLRVRGTGLTTGDNTSCGCYKEEVQLNNLTHGAGEANPAWRGGVSFGKYCPRFNRPLKEEIRQHFDRRCYLCGDKEGKVKLHIHHVDYNKVQGCKGMRWSLLPLCPKCHTKTNHNRWYWFNRLINYWAEPYMP
jgi:hypothetical protein